MTQNADIIRQLAGVIEQVDAAPAEVVSEFIKLERADASKVVDMLKDIFEKGTETGPAGCSLGQGAWKRAAADAGRSAEVPAYCPKKQ